MSKLHADQTPEGWDKTTNKYAGKFAKNGFTGKYANDALDLTMGKEITRPNVRVLDVACGAGALSLNALDRVKQSENSLVIATDFSLNMVECVREVIKEEQLTGIEANVMDGQNMTNIVNDSIDYAYSIFGAIFFPDKKKGFSEFYRVLKPNGQVAISSWCYDSAICQIFIHGLEHFGIDVEKSPLKETGLSLADRDAFKAQLEQAGFADVHIHRVVHEMVIPNATDLVAMFQSNPAYESIIAALPPHSTSKSEFDATITQHILDVFPSLVLPSPSFIGVGTKK
ncbi:hypothetical protein CYY_002193 [Polysphondylium violaceum]|uniref:phosphoethanolamine N-methyltransferase n=1 Tax=Polysphondylium violaceum TaxID=133409 RepID=A0A8J4V102_9MYCE|nr:hypothetical protein CYY_002193 [Polysphondylium violaceum]